MSAPQGSWQEQLFRMDKAKTIALITITVLLLAGAGTLAGVVAQSDLPPLDSEPLPLGDQTSPDDSGVKTGGLEQRPSFSVTGGALAAGPLAQVSPSPLSSPSPAASPTPLPSPSPTPPPDGGFSVVLGGGVATIPLPAPWVPIEQTPDGLQAWMVDGRGNVLWAGVFNVGPGADMAQLLGANAPNLVSYPYSSIEFQAPTPLATFGSITSIAAVNFRGTATDSQGSLQVQGGIVAATRADGQALVITQETIPPEHWDASLTETYPVLSGGFNNFAGL